MCIRDRGSTDPEGNRLSNLPGERPSFASVAPYDDKPEVLISKVEKVAQKVENGPRLLETLTKQ